MTIPRFLALTAVAIFTVNIATAAQPDAIQAIRTLVKQGHHQQALEQTNRVLDTKPKDAQARFLKGVILTEMNRTQEAIVIFSKLTEDYPEYPEPYNNLAVLYAQQRQYDKAKNALEMAIRTHPAYATAYENLGDIYARMASQAYDKALQIDSSNTAAQTKLSVIRDLVSAPTQKTSTPTTIASKPPVTVARVEPEKRAATAPKATESESKPAIVETKPVIEAKPVETKPESEPKAPQIKPTDNQSVDLEKDAEKAVHDWAKAWSRRDIKAYLSFYAKDFQTGGKSRASWESERTRRITGPKQIDVKVDDLEISMEGNDRAAAKFRQHYRSSSFQSSVDKTLELVHRDGRWHIQQERVGRR